MATTRPGEGGALRAGRSAAVLDALPLSGWHRRITAIVGLGSFFDLYEVFLGGVMATVLAPEWHLGSNGKALVISSAFIGMFIGANLLSVLADRFGRRRVFIANLLSYSLLSIAGAFSPDLAVLTVLRIAAGIGVGAELVLVDTYLAEFLPARERGRYISIAYIVGFIGVPVVALLGARLVAKHHFLGLAGWRWLLIAGGLGALVVVAARSTLPESPRWLETKGRNDEADRVVDRILAQVGVSRPAPAPAPAAAAVERRVSLGDMFRPPWLKRTVMWWIFQILQTVGYYGFGSLAPLVLTAKGYTVTSSLGYSALSFIGYPIGAIVATPLVERIERKYLIVASAVAIAGFGLVFGLGRDTALIVAAGFLLTVSSNVFSNAFHAYQTEIFPTAVRSSAVGIAYSLSRAVSALLPFVAVRLLADIHAGGVFTVSAVLIGLLCVDVAALGPKTNGLALESSAYRDMPGAAPAPHAEANRR